MRGSGSFTPIFCSDHSRCNHARLFCGDDCAVPPTLLAQYQFSGHQMINMDGDIVPLFTYDTDPSSMRTIVKVSEGGSGLCEGELDLYSMDGKSVFSLKPELNADNTITGD